MASFKAAVDLVFGGTSLVGSQRSRIADVLVLSDCGSAA